MELLLRTILILSGIAGVLDTICVLAFSNVNLGTVFPGIAGTFLFLSGVFYHKIQNITQYPMGHTIKVLFFFGAAIFLVSFVTCSLLIYTQSAKAPEDGADAVIVLGAGLNGDRVSKTLSYRLDCALSYYSKNPQAVIVVSGGQGANELITEASAMKLYLIGKGVPASQIIEEDASTNTVENFIFSKALLDTYFQGEAYQIVYITNDFHTYRAGLIARQCGFDAQGMSAKSHLPLLPNFYIREYFSIIKYWAFDSRRDLS